MTQASTEAIQGAFDPLSDLLAAQSERPERLRPVNLRVISPFLRALLTIDGTVTKLIEAVAMEPVHIERLSQTNVTLSADHPWLEAAAGTEVIAREVLLRGARTGTIFAYAPSLLITARLDEEIQEALERHPGGIGRVLLEAKLETRREILWYGREHVGDDPAHPHPLGEMDVISRAYQVIRGGSPIMLINEQFPARLDLAPMQS